ncbi:MAG: ABC transporter substrate-binding protein [Rubellimicrobium sp.]|nr:ABC transporter substrate-binding protein [Rubellimicrobium sp.]
MTLSFDRRGFLAVSGTALIASLAALPAGAMSLDQARAHVDRLVAEVNRVIASGESESEMIAEFAVIFDRFADVPTIARYSLGSDARAASARQMEDYTAAFRSYIARKYGRRFREFIGGQIVVVEARNVPSGIEVETTAILQNQAPFRVDWHVSDASGRIAFFNIIIEGVNMLLSERTEIQAMLDQRGRDLNRLIADLPSV